MELQKEVAQQTQLELPSPFVFDYPSIAEMCAFVLASLPPEASQATTTAAGQPPARSVSPRMPHSSATSAHQADSASHPVWMYMNRPQRRAYMDEKVQGLIFK